MIDLSGQVVAVTGAGRGLGRLDAVFREDSGFLNVIAPELVVPMVTYLASRKCTVTRQNFSACAGRFARVFTGLGSGWAAETGVVPTAEQVAEHFGDIEATQPFTVPGSIFDEVLAVCELRGVDAFGASPQS
ncbi:MAG: hypothetical protein U0R77_11825 [Mycolicibacterium insubricum]|nr:hypothetical protein [Mycobacterium sp.]